jgi:GAF domain-containing protein
VSNENVAEDFARMAMTLHDERTLEQTVDRVLEFALKALGCSYAGVVFVHRQKRVETFAATDPLVEHLDKVQFEVGEGPDIEIIEDRRGVIVDDTTTDNRWPAWSKRVAEAGVRSMLGTRLHTSETTIGSLNLYDVRAGAFTAEDRAIAEILARHAAVAMQSTREQANLWKAIDARQLIGQAQGILMERFAIDADQAFTVLRRYSQDRNVKLNVVAQLLIETRRLPD